MNNRIQKLSKQVQVFFENAEKGHDYWHALRVLNNVLVISKIEGGNVEIMEASALLHDVIDSKFAINNDESVLLAKAIEFLKNAEFNESEINEIITIISQISFKGGFQEIHKTTIELQIVQDADRLDAMGAIGIARAFQYGGFKNRELYNPTVEPKIYTDAHDYRNSKTHTINHFYEKLLLLRDKMNTKTGKKMAQERHDFMQLYLKHFYSEWNNTQFNI